MKRFKCLLALLLCLCLSGCSLLGSGSHIYVQEHQPHSTTGTSQNISVVNYSQLYDALAQMARNGVTQQTISVEQYDKVMLESDLDKAVKAVRANDPIAAYAVEDILYTVGTVSGMDALSVEISYLHDKTELRQIVTVADNKGAQEAIAGAMNDCEPYIVLYIEDFTLTDFTQVVEDYALAYPEYVMEQPQVSVSVYPEQGASRVVELKFMYHTSRESLKNMQSQVSLVFRSAYLYVSGDSAAEQKYSQLYSFLMERFHYTFETSVTPTYSLLRHGVGNCRSFSSVYAAMCRQSELTCLLVSGTRSGENWFWNIVQIDDVYYHIDLLSEDNEGVFRIYSDEQMRQLGYLWDFDAYPDCLQTPYMEENETPPEETEENNEN